MTYTLVPSFSCIIYTFLLWQHLCNQATNLTFFNRFSRYPLLECHNAIMYTHTDNIYNLFNRLHCAPHISVEWYLISQHELIYNIPLWHLRSKGKCAGYISYRTPKHVIKNIAHLFLLKHSKILSHIFDDASYFFDDPKECCSNFSWRLSVFIVKDKGFDCGFWIWCFSYDFVVCWDDLMAEPKALYL